MSRDFSYLCVIVKRALPRARGAGFNPRIVFLLSNLLGLFLDSLGPTHSCARISDLRLRIEVGFGVGMLVGVIIDLSLDFHGSMVTSIGQFIMSALIFLKSIPCSGLV